MAANPQTKPTNLGCESADKWLLPSTFTIAIRYYYSARKPILILLSHGGWKADPGDPPNQHHVLCLKCLGIPVSVSPSKIFILTTFITILHAFTNSYAKEPAILKISVDAGDVGKTH